MTTYQNLFDDSGWQEAPGYPAGTFLKTVYEKNGMKTFVLKIPAGFTLNNHSHLFTEQHVIVQGECTIDGRILGPGSYNHFSSGESHGPFFSEKGATILVIWNPEV